MKRLLVDLLIGFDWFVLIYFLVLNTSYFTLVVVAAKVTIRSLRRPNATSHLDIFANPLTPPISILIAAFNEEKGIVQCARATLDLRYPQLEVVVVDDGSTDATFACLREEFGLVDIVPVLEPSVITRGEVLSMHVPRSGEPLVVIRKRNGGKADALNVGLNAARFPLVCFVDGDSILERDALLRVSKPFVDDPDRVVASGGVIRAVNGSTVYRGQLTDIRQPRSWLARIQIVEYLRSFLLGRTGLARLGILLIISGAFGLYRRDLVVKVGGFDPTLLGEDADLVIALHRHMRDVGQEYKIAFVAEPVCWTEVPTTRAMLGRQRRRWSTGLAQVLWKHRGMFGRPRYGRVGMVAMPYYLLFELLGPVIEIVGIATVILAFGFGVVDAQFALLFASVAILYSIALSIAAMLVEEATFHRYGRWRDTGVAVVAAVAENIGYRQLHAWWRLRGLISALHPAESTWGAMTRSGFDAEVGEATSTGTTRGGRHLRAVRP